MDNNLLDNLSGQEIKELINEKAININELTNSALEKVLDFEIQMLCHGSGNMDIIHQCSEVLDNRNKSNKLNEDEIRDIINKTKAKHITVVDVKNEPSKVAPVRKSRTLLKRIAIVAAAIIIMATTIAVIATAFDMDIIKFLKNITGEPNGTVVNVDEFTFYNSNGAKKYDTVQQMAEIENLEIMYPTSLPDGVDIRSIRLTNNANNNDMLQLITNNAKVNLHIELNASEFTEYSDNIYEHGGVKYYIHLDEGCIATCFYKSNVYYVSAENYDDLISIINSMKE